MAKQDLLKEQLDNVRDSIPRVSKRINQLEEISTELEKRVGDEKHQINISNENINNIISDVRDEIKSMTEEIDKLLKSVFQIGHQLKFKLPKQEMERLEATLNEWPLEEFVTREELMRKIEKI